MFDQRSARVIVTLVNQGADALKDLVEEAKNAAGLAADIREIRLDTLLGDFRILVSNIQTFFTEFGQTFQPVLRSIVQGFTNIIQATTDWIKEFPELARASVILLGISSVVLVLGGALLSVVGIFSAFVGAIGAAATALGPLTIAIPAIGVALVALTVSLLDFNAVLTQTLGLVQAVSDFKLSLDDAGVRRSAETLASASVAIRQIESDVRSARESFELLERLPELRPVEISQLRSTFDVDTDSLAQIEQNLKLVEMQLENVSNAAAISGEAISFAYGTTLVSVITTVSAQLNQLTDGLIGDAIEFFDFFGLGLSDSLKELTEFIGQDGGSLLGDLFPSEDERRLKQQEQQLKALREQLEGIRDNTQDINEVTGLNPEQLFNQVENLKDERERIQKELNTLAERTATASPSSSDSLQQEADQKLKELERVERRLQLAQDQLNGSDEAIAIDNKINELRLKRDAIEKDSTLNEKQKSAEIEKINQQIDAQLEAVSKLRSREKERLDLIKQQGSLEKELSELREAADTKRQSAIEKEIADIEASAQKRLDLLEKEKTVFNEETGLDDVQRTGLIPTLEARLTDNAARQERTQNRLNSRAATDRDKQRLKDLQDAEENINMELEKARKEQNDIQSQRVKDVEKARSGEVRALQDFQRKQALELAKITDDIEDDVKAKEEILKAADEQELTNIFGDEDSDERQRAAEGQARLRDVALQSFRESLQKESTDVSVDVEDAADRRLKTEEKINAKLIEQVKTLEDAARVQIFLARLERGREANVERRQARLRASENRVRSLRQQIAESGNDPSRALQNRLRRAEDARLLQRDALNVASSQAGFQGVANVSERLRQPFENDVVQSAQQTASNTLPTRDAMLTKLDMISQRLETGTIRVDFAQTPTVNVNSLSVDPIDLNVNLDADSLADSLTEDLANSEEFKEIITRAVVGALV